ncbi:MAG TPA: ABC transporter permease [Candidatus Limnocylindria bacterium]|jgi:oligopeptide transport system permease protein|nr:ABC transporter permease [Candidatus Limnocylindria bacterium]
MATAVTTARPQRAGELGVVTRKQRSLWQDAFSRLLRNKAAIAGLVVIVIAALVAILAEVNIDAIGLHFRLAPYDPLEQNTPKQLMEPVWTQAFGSKYTDSAYILGSDALGRDILSRLMFGARISLVVGFVPVAIIFVIGGAVGMLAGYLGGWVDNLLMRFTDIVYAFPDLLFVIIIVGTLRDTGLGQLLGGLILIFVGIAVVSWVGLARLMRGQVLSLKHREFIEAARCIGATPIRIMAKHLFPNILAPIIVSIAFAIPGAMLTEATLSFLGVGIRPPTPTWGAMILDGFIVFSATPWPVLLPAFCISIVLLAFTFVGDGLRDALDPRMKL